ncbi:MAG: hypothetical protein JKY52_08570 [Flavobacteriales bacterium]|nr:hypothetical protein [Flavobacteriales bacterium]
MAGKYIPLGANTYNGNAYGFPSVLLENWFAEEAGDRNDRPYRLLPTPGLTSFASGLNGAIRGMIQSDGLLDSKAVIAAGSRVYSMTSAGATVEIGTITGTDEARFAGSQSDMVMTAGGVAFVVTTGLAPISIPGATGNIVDCAELAQRHLFIEEGSGRFWYSDTAQPASVPATNFATTESESDQLVGIRVVGDVVYLIGTRTTELWEYTGSKDIPFRPIQGAVAKIGIFAKGAVTEADGGLFALGRDQDGNEVVYRIQNAQPVRISTYPIDRLIAEVTEENRPSIRLSAHGWGGHSFIGLHLPSVGDYFYDISNGTWHRRKELAESRYLVQHFFAAFGEKFAGDVTVGTVYRLDLDVYTHNLKTVRRVASTIIPVTDSRPTINNLTVEMQGGVGLVTGQGQNPKVMLRWAVNGRTFSNELTTTFGLEGEFGHRAVFDSLGELYPPAVAINIAVTDPVNATVTGLVINRDRL